MSESTRDAKNLRKAHNAELIRRMMKGETLTSFDSQSSWYPPRPIIKKDLSEISRLYSPEVSLSVPEVARQTNRESAKEDQGRVVQLYNKPVPLKRLDDAS